MPLLQVQRRRQQPYTRRASVRGRLGLWKVRAGHLSCVWEGRGRWVAEEGKLRDDEMTM